MSKLILHPTDISQWHALVNEAQASTHLILNEDTEGYLVFLLMRFSQTSHLMESIVALDFLEAMNTVRTRQLTRLQEVGDKSLLFCGLFPGIADRHHVRLDYYTEMGQAAYLTLGELEKRSDDLFFQLSHHFVAMQQILQAMRGGCVQLNNPHVHESLPFTTFKQSH